MLQVLGLFCLIFVMADTITDSSEDNHAYTYNSFYAPSTLNFNDIYANHLVGTVTEDESSLTTEENPNTAHVLAQFVEFHPDTMTQPPVTIPPPKYILNATYMKDTTTTSTTTTEDPDDVKVMPIRRRNYQRGVLDLLFPSARVKGFKNVFDSIRRILSHTFRRR